MKILRILALCILTFCVLSFLNQYLFCPQFTFPRPEPFRGDSILNPYAQIRSDQWVKANFHAHAKAWQGVTNGHGNAAQIHQAYQQLGYGIHCVSNYQSIDSTGGGEPGYIPAYEHGYNIEKTHQLVLGESAVEWLDYLLPQTLYNKQDVLNHLKNPNSVVILNHPALRNGYKESDFASLTGYDCMEVLNPSVISTRHWDAALSAGRRVFVVGDDDLHDIVNRDRLGKMCTFVNIDKPSKAQVLSALKSGRSYGAVLAADQKPGSVPYLDHLWVRGSTVEILLSEKAAQILITGQNGKTIARFKNTDVARFDISQSDHYARATARFENGTELFFNPVFFTDDASQSQPVAHEDFLQTIFYRTLGVAILFSYLTLLGMFLVLKKLPPRSFISNKTQ